jgi:hypothetical protein
VVVVVVGFGRVYRRCGRTIPFFLHFTVSIGGGVGRFVPMVMVVERWLKIIRKLY